MPQSTLSLRRVLELLPPGLPRATLNDRLFASKAEATIGDGDELKVEVTPDRLDLLSEGGLGVALAGAVAASPGPVRVRRRRRPEAWRFVVDPSVAPLRPVIAGALVRPPVGGSLDEGLLAEAVRFQELLHATVGRDRRAMSLGIYPAGRIDPPVRYALTPTRSLRFVPLDGTEEVPADRFFSESPMAARYGALGRTGESCLALTDSEGDVLSLPPVLNSRTAGEARPGDRELLLESTGTRPRPVREGIGLLLLPFVARGWSVVSVPAVRADGSALAPEEGPDATAPRKLPLPLRLVRDLSGEGYAPEEVVRRLRAVRLGARRVAGGWTVTIPPWRPDLTTAVELVEDVVLAEPVRPESGVRPASPTRGRRLPETAFRRRTAALLLGLGIAELHTPVLVPAAAVHRLGSPEPIELANPVSAEFAYLRDRLLVSHLEVLAHNTRHAYPQRFGEVAPVVRRAPAAETGGETRWHAGVLLAGEGLGLADAAGLVDYLLRELDVASVREPAELPGTIPGRAARVRVAGEPVAELGEIHPRLLSELGVPVPVAWAEIDLTSLWPLVAGADGP
jgi:phenylalanyl-tRNA synthetase beta chain